MIFYFSGTGNTRWAAIKLAAVTHERLIDVAEEMRRMKSPDKNPIEPFVLQENERLGFIFPVHGWRVPKLVREFISLSQIQFTRQPFVYAVCTAGDSIGKTIENLNESIASNASLTGRGVTEVSSSYSLIMPESYVGLPFMDVDPKHKETRKKEQASKELDTICKEVYEREKDISRLTRGPIPWFFTKIVGGIFEHILITDKRFHVTANKCTKCGICANVCPTKDIQGGKGKMPIWLHHKDCLTCFSCYHHCPHHAIEFGKQTQKKGQYYYK